ncbi:MAG: thioesterase domain-containing protein [Gammaproteobacteria bacterium]|jgi:thioesterase domain-containing protein|nr:thioesterase domain-containing protein [Gammaproteobacteria bacterium]
MKLAQQMKAQRPVYALNYVYETDAIHTIPSSVQELAKVYIEEVLAVQTTGPYYLFGFSYGATIAFEIARQLEAMGHEVAHLCLAEPPLNPRSGVEMIRDTLGEARSSGPHFAQLRFLINVCAGIIVRRPKVITRRMRTWWHRKTNTMMPPRLRWVNYLTHMAPAVRSYRFEPIRGPLDFFYRDHGEEGFKGTQHFWESIVESRVTVHAMSDMSEHLDMMGDAALEDIAAVLDSAVSGLVKS